MIPILSPEDVVKLVANEELEKFCRLLDLEIETPISRKEIMNRISRCSRTKVLFALVSVNGIWITMIRDIARFLQSNGVSLRTTGCLIVLPVAGENMECLLSPQVSGILANFDFLTCHNTRLTDWDSGLAHWENEMSDWISQILRDGEPSTYERIDRRKVSRVAMGYPVGDFYKRVIDIQGDAIERVFSLWRTLDYLADKMNSVNVHDFPPAAQQLAGRITDFAHDIGQMIQEWKCDDDVWNEITRYVRETEAWSESSVKEDLFGDDCWTGEDGWDGWVRFVENILSLASLESADELSDLFRIDLLKDRPRLFEVWCLAQVLSFYRTCGCSIELLSLCQNHTPVWNLNYSRANKPVAKIERKDDQWWLFYQLFRSGSDRANMPDLALLKGRNHNSEVIWIADPKYSEEAAYRRRDYEKVAARYSEAFHAQQVWICEFFARRDWFKGDCHAKGDKFSILTEVQPNGEGTRLLKRDIRELHDFGVNHFILAIDYSDSFTSTLSQIAGPLKSLSVSADAVICFADSAKEVVTGQEAEYADIQRTVQLVGNGTLLAPLVTSLENVSVRDNVYTDLILVSDEEFSDSTDGLREKLESLFAEIEVARDEISIAEIANRRCERH